MARAKIVQSGTVVRYMRQSKFLEVASVQEANEHVKNMNMIARRRKMSYWVEVWKYIPAQDDYLHISRLNKKRRWFSQVYRIRQTRLNFNK